MNQVRIIGGEWKRRLIRFEAVNGLRPTPDRVRETLFNWLMWDVSGKQVLDTCAGSGALGIEALSRGARHCVFIEADRKQAELIKANLVQLQCTTAKVIFAKAEQALVQLPEPVRSAGFDLVFLDPPYSLNLWTPLATLIDPLLNPAARIYIEADRPLQQLELPAHWQLLKETRAGQVHAGLYQTQKAAH
ncbi:16S rRNA (guanine(966)-N(2))-methyltransferase RsmD [Alkanindiges hydrocarboniclasticus]|uniref:Ribosomal RNA small subunit methyltransferase D n=1 Tax=Alkanindiges hydrocarboniclasticus TaxID=1907941 RepID=A0A1S8CTR9_9GAMM|nr:16S rRNA (guanine(966)-N(2))-methyltransferase RsmD [Alkanindiges hydrocarboniclasticus]ONG39567.1 16S rRNA (guanine(966)-N(2))-methyltransferase RsmD [Alkanindiges hydrocarboniclasticus]